MIRITRQTDYAVVMLTYLAGKPVEQVHTARGVASATRLPLPTVSKILKVLGREGLVSSHRGVKGGYSLAIRPEEITLAQVIRAMEGPIGMTECTTTPGTCGQEAICPVRVNWARVSTAVREALESVRLSEMVAPVPSQPLLAVDDPLPRQDEPSLGRTGPETFRTLNGR